jgi:tRNA wybutosine-synthesizing protein 4
MPRDLVDKGAVSHRFLPGLQDTTRRSDGLSLPQQDLQDNHQPRQSHPPHHHQDYHQEEKMAASTRQISRVKLTSSEHFAQIVRTGQPVVLKQCDLGPCSRLWDADYLGSMVGESRLVTIHESSDDRMDFSAKNFRYKTVTMKELLERAGQGDKVYLRALSREAPADRPAELSLDFPELAPDFTLPAALSAHIGDQLFSSVLRVSGRVSLWLHYDVMANVYCQVSGSRRLVLFAPGDVGQLSFAPGSSTSGMPVFVAKEGGGGGGPAAAETQKRDGGGECAEDVQQTGSAQAHVADLGPGDILFLPPLWPHAATATTSDMSIAVNVFFRTMHDAYAAGRDVYGNRDLAAYERGRADIYRIVGRFKGLPADACTFYLQRLADELRDHS